MLLPLAHCWLIIACGLQVSSQFSDPSYFCKADRQVLQVWLQKAQHWSELLDIVEDLDFCLARQIRSQICEHFEYRRLPDVEIPDW